MREGEWLSNGSAQRGVRGPGRIAVRSVLTVPLFSDALPRCSNHRTQGHNTHTHTNTQTTTPHTQPPTGTALILGARTASHRTAPQHSTHLTSAAMSSKKHSSSGSGSSKKDRTVGVRPAAVANTVDKDYLATLQQQLANEKCKPAPKSKSFSKCQTTATPRHRTPRFAVAPPCCTPHLPLVCSRVSSVGVLCRCASLPLCADVLCSSSSSAHPESHRCR